MENINERMIRKISNDLSISKNQIANTIELIQSGNTILS